MVFVQGLQSKLFPFAIDLLLCIIALSREYNRFLLDQSDILPQCGLQNCCWGKGREDIRG